MNNPIQEVLIFRTSVNTPEAIRKVAPLLNGHPLISKWSFDLEDCDKVLRVEAYVKIPGEIIATLRSEGFDCEEMV
jgi:hypothetical protein